MGRVDFLRESDLHDFERTRRTLVRALERLEGFDPVLDLPLIEEVARSAIYVRRGERFLDDPECSAGTYAAVSDARAKQAARMRAAIKELAAMDKHFDRIRGITRIEL